MATATNGRAVSQPPEYGLPTSYACNGRLGKRPSFHRIAGLLERKETDTVQTC